MPTTLSPAPRATALRCDLVARGVARATAGELPALRRAPGALGGVAVSPSFLRHADGQTAVGLAAVLRAVDDGGLDPAGFADWGVVAAPRFLGRAAFDAAFPLFLAEGAWGVSPVLIASHSLHAVSGAVSQALKARGPNLGVGGAPGGEADAFLTAAVWLDSAAAPGVWVVLTGWTPGWDGAGDGGDPGVCEALAVALTAPTPGWAGARVRVAPGELTIEPAAGSARWRVDAGSAPRSPSAPRAAGVGAKEGVADAR